MKGYNYLMLLIFCLFNLCFHVVEATRDQFEIHHHPVSKDNHFGFCYQMREYSKSFKRICDIFRENSICWIENSIEDIIRNMKIFKRYRNKKCFLWKDFVIQYSYNGNACEKFEMRIFPFVFSKKQDDIVICFPPFEKYGIPTLKTGAFSIMYLRTVMLSYAYFWMKANFNYHNYNLRCYIAENKLMYPLDFLRYRQPYVELRSALVENWMKFAQIFINNLSKSNFIHYFFWLQMKRDFNIDYFYDFEIKMNQTTNIIDENKKVMEKTKIENLSIQDISEQINQRRISYTNSCFENDFDDPKYTISKIKNKPITNNFNQDRIFNQYIEKKKNKPENSKLTNLNTDEIFQTFFFNRENKKHSEVSSQTRIDVQSTTESPKIENNNECSHKLTFDNSNPQSKIFEPKILDDEKVSFDTKNTPNQDHNFNKSSFEGQKSYPSDDKNFQEPFSPLFVRKPKFNIRSAPHDKRQNNFEKFASRFVKKKSLMDTHLNTDEMVEIFLNNRKKYTDNLNEVKKILSEVPSDLNNKKKDVSQNKTKQNFQKKLTLPKSSFNTEKILFSPSNDKENNSVYNSQNESGKKSFDFEKFASQFAEFPTQTENLEENFTPNSSFDNLETLLSPFNDDDDQEQNLKHSKHENGKNNFDFEIFASQISESSNSIDYSHQGTSNIPFYDRKLSHEKSSFKKLSSKNQVPNFKNDFYFIINGNGNENENFKF